MSVWSRIRRWRWVTRRWPLPITLMSRKDLAFVERLDGVNLQPWRASQEGVDESYRHQHLYPTAPGFLPVPGVHPGPDGASQDL